jgi:hypothetical protein
VVIDDKTSRPKAKESGQHERQPIDLLPDELMIRIFSFLNENDLFRTSEVCRRWNRLSFDLNLWEEKSKRWLSAQNLVRRSDPFKLTCQHSTFNEQTINKGIIILFEVFLK